MNNITQMDVEYYFPFEKPRKGQMETIKQVVRAVECGKHYIMLDAPTGFGKSAVARTIVDYMHCRYDYPSYILTATKQLQHQYHADTEINKHNVNYQVGLGRNNFACHYYDNTLDMTTCDKGYCLKRTKKEPKCKLGFHSIDANGELNVGSCEYWSNKKTVTESDVALLNYDVLMIDNLYVNHYPFRQFMICDEAHNIEDKISSKISINLSGATLQRDINFELQPLLTRGNNIEEWIDIIKIIIRKYEEEIESYNEDVTSGDMIKDGERLIKTLERRVKVMTSNLQRIEQDKNNFIACEEPTLNRLKIKPIFSYDYADEVLFNASEYHILMSGSFISKEHYTKWLGINEDDIEYIHANSSFDFKRRNPISKKFLAGNMSYKHKKETMPKTIGKIKGILAKHKDHKGLIHTNSREFTNYIIENVNDDRLITYDSKLKQDKDKKLQRFKNSSKPLVMVAYSMEEGVDLPYDDCRFQIFYKTPYLALNDKQIKARMNQDKDWYQIKALQKWQQSYGRGMRAEDDWCRNYLIDTGFYALINNKYFPTEMKEALI